MSNPFEVIKALEAESSTTAKVAILKANDSPELQWVLKKACDSLVTFGIKQYEFNEPIAETPFDQDWKYVQSVIAELEMRKLTGNAARQAIFDVSCRLNAQQQYVFACILDKDLKCGVNTKLVNKAFRHLINDFAVQLANKDTDKIKYPVMCEEKHNGKRNIAMVNGNTVTQYSRNGILQENYAQFEEQLCQLANGEQVVFDGEVRGVASHHEEQYNQVKRYAKKKDGKSATKAEDLIYVIWDVIPLSEWQRSMCSTGQLARSKKLEGMFIEWMNEFEGEDLLLRRSKHTMVNSEEQLKALFDKKLADGKEGLIAKDPQAKYEYKRSNAWIKLKVDQEEDLPIVDFVEVIEKKTKHTGRMGAIICDYNGVKVHCAMGKGISHDEAVELWNNRKKLVGKTARIKYMNVTVDANGKSSLYLPKFMEVRDDK